MPKIVEITKKDRKMMTRWQIAMLIEHWIMDGGAIGGVISSDKYEAWRIISQLRGRNLEQNNARVAAIESQFTLPEDERSEG